MEPDPVTGIREAVAAGEYRRAEQLWNAYATSLQTEIRERTLTQPRLDEVRALIDWSRTVVLCARSHAQDRLKGLRVGATYDSGLHPTPAHLLQVQI